MPRFIALVAILLFAFVATAFAQNQQAILAQTKANILASSKLNSASIGSNLAGQIDLTFKTNGGLPVTQVNITINNNPPLLVVTGKTTVWGNTPITATASFFFASAQSTQMEMQIAVQVSNLALAQLFGNVFSVSEPNGRSELALLRQLQLAPSTSNIDFVYSSTAYNSYQTGITLSTVTVFAASSMTSALARPAAGGLSLLQAFKTLKPSATAGSSTLTTQLYARSVNDFQLEITDVASTGFVLPGTQVHVSGYTVNVNILNTSLDVSLSAQFSVPLGNQNVQFSGSAAYATGSPTKFSGNLGAISNFLGYSWLSLQQATVNMVIGSQAAVDTLSISAKALVSFATSPVTLTLNTDGSGNFMISLNQIPLGSGAASLAQIYTALTKASAPGILSQLTVSNGQLNIALANYNTGSVVKGLTLSATVSVSAGGSVSSALAVLASSSSTRNYEIDLFVPLFGAHVDDINFTIKETGSFALTQTISVSDYTLAVVVAPETSSSSFVLSGDLAVTADSQTTPVLFSVSATWNENQQPQQVNLNGALKSAWTKPFGLSWLTIDTATITVIAQFNVAPRVSVAATGDISWKSSGDQSAVTIELTAAGAYVISATGIPFGGSNAKLSAIYSAITSAPVPQLMQELQATSGTVGFTLASQNVDSFKQGFSLNVQVTVAADSQIGKAAQVIQPGTGARTYQLTLFVPVYSQQPQDISLTLVESGTFQLLPSISCSGYQLQVAIASGNTVSITASLNANVALKNQASPVQFNLNAQWQEATSQFTFTGTLASSWNQAFGFEWLSLTAATLTVTLAQSAPADSFSIAATASVAFSTASSVDMAINVKGDGNFLLSVSNLPFTSIAVMFISVTQGGDVPKALVGVSTTGTASFALATYDGASRKGFTLTVSASVSGGQLQQVIQDIDQNAASRTYQLSFFSPVFGPAPASNVDISLQETGAFFLGTTGISVDSYGVTIDVSTNTEVALTTQLSVIIPEQQKPVSFSLSGTWQEQTGLVLSGSLVGGWPSPFGQKWLAINTATASIALQAASVSSFSLAASGTITAESETVQANFAITLPTPQTFILTTTVQTSWSLAQMVKMATGSEVALVADAVRSGSASVSFTLNNVNQGSTPAGLTFAASAKIQGDLFSKVKVLSPDSQSLNNGLTFVVGVFIPVFSSDPADLTLSLSVKENIPLTSHLAYESFEITVAIAPLAVSASVDLLATFSKNPPLNFVIGGAIAADESFTFTGQMVGTWDNVFGFKYFDLSNVILQFGVNPAMCAVDFCISDLGLGFDMQIGTKNIKFDGNAAAPDFEDVYLAGSITGNDGMALTVLDVVLEWNKMLPQWAINTNEVPQDWGIANTAFFLAPDDGHFGNTYYAAGFGITGGIRIIDIDLDISVNCTDQTADWCNFGFHVDIDLSAFTNWIKTELSVLGKTAYTFDEAASLGIPTTRADVDSDIVIFRVNSVGLSEWSAQHLSQGQYPRWQVDLDVFDKNHLLDFNTEQSWLAGTFHSYFKKWLEYLFH